MAVAVDAVGSADVSNFPGATSVNFTNLTIGGGLTNSALLAILAFNTNATPPTGLTVTWNGTPLSLITNTTISDATISEHLLLYGLANPAAGNQTLAVSWSSGTTAYSIDAMSFSGVDQTTPFQNGTTATATSQTPSVTITSSVGNYAVASFATTVAWTSVDPTVIFQDSVASYPVAAANYIVGNSPSVTLSAVSSSPSRWIASGVDVKAVSIVDVLQSQIWM